MRISRTRKKSYKNRFITSIITLLLTVSCFVSVSYAWFTNSAYVSGNKVFAGNLMVDVLISEEDLKANLVKSGVINNNEEPLPGTLDSFKYVREFEDGTRQTYYYASRIPATVNEQTIDTSIIHVENVEPGQAIRVKVNIVNSGDLALKAAGALRVEESLTGLQTFKVNNNGSYPNFSVGGNMPDASNKSGYASIDQVTFLFNTLLNIQAEDTTDAEGDNIITTGDKNFKDVGGHLEDVLCVYLLEDVGDGDLNFEREDLNETLEVLKQDERFFGTLKQFQYMLENGANPTEDNKKVYDSYFSGSIELNAHDYKRRLERDYQRYLAYASGYCLPLSEMQEHDNENKIPKDGKNVEVFDADGKSLYTRMGVSEIDTINFLLYMPLEAGDEYQNASISLSLGATASQVEYEKDDFDYMIYDMSAQNTSHTAPLTPPSRGDLIKIDGKKYRVLDINENKEAKLLAMYDASLMIFYSSEEEGVVDTTEFKDGVNGTKYANSDIDTYLNEAFYENLSFKNAIIEQNINQSMYKFDSAQIDPNADATSWYKSWFVSTNVDTDENAYKYTVTKYDSVVVGPRYVYLLDVEDVINYLGPNFSPQQLNTMFWDTDRFYEGVSPNTYTYLRSADKDNAGNVWITYGVTGALGVYINYSPSGIRPAFVVDLTQVEYAKVID